MFFQTEICYLKYGKKHIFFLYEYCKHVFSQHLLKYSFHIILNNDTRNLQQNSP